MKKPLIKRIFYGFLVICLWISIFLSPKYLGLHMGAIDAGILSIILSWLFSVATDLDMGFPELDFNFSDYRKKSDKEDK